MKKQQYIVFGLNRFGTSVARTLAAAGNEVVAVDQDADRVAQIADDVSYAVQVDVADEDAMSGLGMEHMDGAVIAVASNMEASIVIAMKCKEYNIPQIIATGKNEVHGKVLKKLGVTRVVFPEVEMGARVGKYLIRHVIFQTGLICQMITVWSRWQFHQRGYERLFVNLILEINME